MYKRVNGASNGSAATANWARIAFLAGLSAAATVRNGTGTYTQAAYGVAAGYGSTAVSAYAGNQAGSNGAAIALNNERTIEAQSGTATRGKTQANDRLITR
jgi:hypothetical protein